MSIMRSWIYDHNLRTTLRQVLYQMGGGKRDYVDIGYKARACVDHDRKCADIAKGRIKRNG